MHPDHSGELASLNRIEGQVKGIKRMIEDRRYCVDILTQIKAAKSALHRVEQSILKSHIQGCLRSAVESQQELDIQQKIDEVMELLSKRV